jgi:hypothetical protein
MMGPIAAFFTALVGGAVLSRPKLPELEPDPKERQIAKLKEELSTLREAHTSLLHMFVDERASRLQLERDLINAEARLEVMRTNAKRSQAPHHLPIAPLTEGAQAPILQQSNAQLMAQQAQSFSDPGHTHMEAIMRQMDAFICNCAPGRHELLRSAAIDGKAVGRVDPETCRIVVHDTL